jgi:hypothetical protein
MPNVNLLNTADPLQEIFEIAQYGLLLPRGTLLQTSNTKYHLKGKFI